MVEMHPQRSIRPFVRGSMTRDFWNKTISLFSAWNGCGLLTYVQFATLCATVNTFCASINTPEPWKTSPGPSRTACHGYAPYGACPAPGLGAPCTGGYRTPHWYGPLKQHRCKPGRHVAGVTTVVGGAYRKDENQWPLRNSAQSLQSLHYWRSECQLYRNHHLDSLVLFPRTFQSVHKCTSGQCSSLSSEMVAMLEMVSWTMVEMPWKTVEIAELSKYFLMK